ncbi:MAG: hypothetical protein IPH77_20860 [Ignavibacteria bacterium]|nr:hypothetical protein [Ignavibacteria bacterium]
MKVKPRLFNWDKREWYEGNKSDGSKMKETRRQDFISQELDEVQTNENADWLNLVLKDNPEKLEDLWQSSAGDGKGDTGTYEENDLLKERLFVWN